MEIITFILNKLSSRKNNNFILFRTHPLVYMFYVIPKLKRNPV